MIFLELTLENFGPYRNRHSLNLQPNKTPRGDSPIILIGGSNGGGKTTLIDAIRFALYGPRAPIDRRRKHQPYSEFLNQSVSRQAPSDATATIELSFQHLVRLSNIDKLAEICVQRSWNRTSSKDKLQVLLDGWPDKILTESWDERVESWLPLGLANLFLFDGEQIKELAEQDSPPPSVAQAIRAVLGLELVDRLASDLEILTLRQQKELANSSDRQALETIDQQLTQQNDDLISEQKKLEALEDELKQAETALTAAQDKFAVEGGTLAEFAPQLARQLTQFKAEAEQSRQNLRHLAAHLLPLGLIPRLLKDTHHQTQIEQHRQQAQAAQILMAERNQRLLDLIQTLKLSQAKTHQIQAFLQQETQSLGAATAGESWLDADADAQTQLNQVCSNQLSGQLQLAQTTLGALQALTTDIEALSLKLAAAPSPEDYERLRSQLDQAIQQHKEVIFKQELGKRRLAQLQQAIVASKAALKCYSDQHIEQQDSSDLLKSAARAQHTLRAFRVRLTQRKLNDLESKLTDYFRLLLHKSNLVHRITIHQASFSLSLYDRQGQPLPKHRLSAGEKQLLAIAFLWALASVSHRQIPIAIDTPLSRLDSSHRANLIQQYFPHASHQMIILSTDTEIGQTEATVMRNSGIIAREYLLHHSPTTQQTTVKSGYFK